MRSRRQSWISRTAAVLAVVFAVSGLPAGGTQAQTNRVCDVDIYIVGFQFMYQTGRRVANNECVYTNALLPARYLSVPNSDPKVVGEYPSTYWFRNITNLDPVTHTIHQCGSRVTSADCNLVPDPHIDVLPLRLAPGQRHTFVGGEYEASFPQCVEYFYMTMKEPEFRWMRGYVYNEGWDSDRGPEPCAYD